MDVEEYYPPEKIRAILNDIIDTFNLPENMSKFAAAKEQANNDMLKTMQSIFPLAAKIQMEIIKGYGFPEDGDGNIQFAKLVKVCEGKDAEIKKLNQILKSYFFPSVTGYSQTDQAE